MSLHFAFAFAVRKLRAEKRLSQIAAANSAQISLSTYKKIENGIHVPMTNTIENLCSGLGITMSELFYETADQLNIQELKKRKDE